MPEAASLLTSSQSDAQEILDYLDLTLAAIRDFGQQILAECTNVDPFDAGMARGMKAYLAAVKNIRHILYRHGWKAAKRGNVELVINHAKNISLCVSSGNKYIGTTDNRAGNRNKKGIECAILVRNNQRQLDFFSHINFNKPAEDLQTWFIFYHFDISERKLRMEIALPLSYSFQTRNIEGFRQRIILPAIAFDDTFIAPSIEDFATEYDFSIKVRKNE
jgi:hypothetical protein